MINHELENYLSRLEQCLGPISISEKAEIVTEIKSHVLDAIENDETKTVSQILASLGEPEQVANKYLLERGLEPQRPPRHPIVKWLTIGFLGTFTIIAAATVTLLWSFTPLIKVDEEKGRVQILGGLIDVNEDNSSVNIGGSFTIGKDKNNLSGEEDFSEQDIEEVKVAFSNGKFSVQNTNENKFIFECEVDEDITQVKPQKEAKSLTFNLSEIADSDCDLELPSKIKLVMDGKNGKIRMKKLKNHISINMMNGRIGFSQDPNSLYSYQNSVMNGKMDTFPSSNSKDAYQIKLSLMNGKIRKL